LLVTEEEERPVAPVVDAGQSHRPPQRAAVLVVTQHGLDPARQGIALCGKSVARIQRVVAEEFVQGSMECVGACFCGYVDHAAAGLAELGPERVGFDAKFFHRIRHRHHGNLVVHRHRVHAAVNEELVAEHRPAIELDLRKTLVGHLRKAIEAAVDGAHARHQAHQAEDVAPIQRQFLDALALHDGAQAGLFELHPRDLTAHRHRLGERAQLQRDVQSEALRDFEHYVGAPELLEAGGLCRYFIGPDRQVRQRIGAVLRGGGPV
jgi:hypothetical protein